MPTTKSILSEGASKVVGSLVGRFDLVKRSCKRQGEVFLAGACSTDGRVGTCRVYKGRNDESLYRYHKNFPGFGVKPKGGVAAAAESQRSKLKGEWTPN